MAQEWIDSRWKGAWSVERNAAISVDRRTFRFPSRGAFDLFLYFEVPLKKKKKNIKKIFASYRKGAWFSLSFCLLLLLLLLLLLSCCC